MDHFGKRNGFLVVLELLYLLFTVYYTLNLIKDLTVIWKKVSVDMDPKVKIKGKPSKCKSFLAYLGLDYSELSENSAVLSLSSLIYR